ncbi:dodecin [Phenylobacterium sp.]|uniref:dodecin n=1 Tax=Phenylobacterium sp. TaxID=1871053 RepID=UPI00286DD155|nr:dodecin [Phenylobacterium sp.]
MTEDNTYGVSEIVGTSKTSVDDAIRTAITKASENRRHIRWFEVTQVRGHVEEGQVAHFQVSLKLGYALEE